MKYDALQDDVYKNLVYTKLEASQCKIFDSNLRNILTTEEKTDLIIEKLLQFKDNDEVKSYEKKHKQSVNQLMSSMTNGEEVLSFLVDNINQINTKLKEQFENFHKHSTLEELIILKDEYKKRNSLNKKPTKNNGLKFESKYIPFSKDLKIQILDSNLQNSIERKDTYNKIFELLREDLRIIIKRLNLNPASINCKDPFLSNHNNSIIFSDINNNENVKVHSEKIEEVLGQFISEEVRATDKPRSNTLDRKPKKHFKLHYRVFSWDKWDYERNLVNLRKDINHFIDLDEIPSEAEGDEEVKEGRGDLLKNIYDICCKFDLDNNTLERVVKKIKNRDSINEIIHKDRERIKNAAYKVNLQTSHRFEMPFIEEKVNLLTKSVKNTLPKNTVISTKVETKTLKKNTIGLNLNNISSSSCASANKTLSKKCTVKKQIIGKQKSSQNDKFFCFSPTATAQSIVKNETFFNSVDLKQSQKLADKRFNSTNTPRDMVKDNTKDNTLGSFVFTPEFFTNPFTNPFTKNLPQYRGNKKTKNTTAQDTVHDTIARDNYMSYSKESNTWKKKGNLIDFDKIIISQDDDSFVVMETVDNDAVKVNKPHFKNYMSNSMNEKPYEILKGSHIFSSALISSKESSFVFESKHIEKPKQTPRAEFCGVIIF